MKKNLKIQTSFRNLILSSVISLFLMVNLHADSPKVRPASEITGAYIDWIKKVADWQLSQSSWDDDRDWKYGVLFTGMMAAYEATKDEEYLNRSRQWAQYYDFEMASDSWHADNHCCAQTYLELYLLDEQDPNRYAHSKSVNDDMVDNPSHFNCDVAGGSEVWWWCDALFMHPPVHLRLSRILGDPSYANLTHMMWAETQDCLYDTNDHLFYRDITYFGVTEGGEEVFWSRGNGWVVGGTVRMLRYMPLDDPNRPVYETLLQEMAAKLKDIQQPDGYWYSNLLYPQEFDMPETSGTGFFTYSIAWGMNNGYLDHATYEPVIEASWEALKAAVHEDGKLGHVQPAGTEPDSSPYDSTAVYGVGAYLLAGSEVQKYFLSKDPSYIDFFTSYDDDSELKAAWNDGSTNGTDSEISLGNYGDRFMILEYDNSSSPYDSRVDMEFATAQNWEVNDFVSLSILLQGKVGNAKDDIYVELEDQSTNTARVYINDTNVVDTYMWHEVAFPFSAFDGVNMDQIKRLSIGVGSETPASSGTGTIRIDTIRLYPVRCFETYEADFDGDCKVDSEDFAVIAGQWMDDYAGTIEPVEPDPNDLVAYWPMDGNFNDVTGNGYNATAGSGVDFNDIKHIGQSAYFPGTDYVSYLACANSTDMNLTTGTTISAWINSSGVDDQWASVVTKGLDAWRLMRNSTSSAISFHFNAAGGSEYQANGSTSVLDGQWHHVMGVYDGNSVRLYVDGELDASVSAGMVNTTTEPVYIGSRVNNTANRNWIGNIDEVRIYNRALSDAELLWLAESDSVLDITDPRETDLHLDGVIDLKDLDVFGLWWLDNSAWP